jgi:hypothetical protein
MVPLCEDFLHLLETFEVMPEATASVYLWRFWLGNLGGGFILNHEEFKLELVDVVM